MAWTVRAVPDTAGRVARATAVPAFRGTVVGARGANGSDARSGIPDRASLRIAVPLLIDL
ncbi:hypothetical protein Q0Z83_077810 [Actinoplanes sichuanensis]|nr:hypothetical protein Q0Z83_077810 [Actinoplanes sichuanensis]